MARRNAKTCQSCSSLFASQLAARDHIRCESAPARGGEAAMGTIGDYSTVKNRRDLQQRAWVCRTGERCSPKLAIDQLAPWPESICSISVQIIPSLHPLPPSPSPLPLSPPPRSLSLFFSLSPISIRRIYHSVRVGSCYEPLLCFSFHTHA